MKKIFLFLMLLCFACFSVARADEVNIGSLDGAANNSYFPMNSLYNYSYTQQIYTADEIGMAGTINSITMWLYGNANLCEMPFDIYMVETDKDAFSSTTDWVSVTAADIVYSGTVTVHNTDAESFTFDLSTQFDYSGNGNLLIAFNNTTGLWKSGLNGKVFGVAEDPIRAIYARQDGSAYDPTNPTFSASGTTYLRDVLLIDITPAGGTTCDKPETIELNSLAACEATISWEGGSGTYNVKYKRASEEEWTIVGENVNYTTYSFTTLTPATTYYFSVQSVCDDDATSGWKGISFTTECAAITSFPWTENFDSYTAASGFLPICWEHINTGTSYATYPYINSYNAHSTSNCLYFYSYGSSSNTNLSDQYAVLPMMENLAGKQINLFAKGYNNQSAFKIGTMTDPTDVTTFTAFATQELTTSYQEFIYFVPASTTDNYLAIMMERPNGTRSVTKGVYIDDITINLPPACPKPLALTVGEVTAHTAQLSWTSDADAWQVMVNNDTLNLIDVTTNPYILEDLADGESYTVTVRANCDVDGYSEWSNNATFTTPIACPAPTGIAATDITGHAATLTWTGNSDSYIVHYRNKVTAEEGLFQGFNTSSVPTGWATYTGLLGGVLADTIDLAPIGSYWAFGSVYNGVFDAHTRINIYSTGVRNWLVSPSVEVAANYVFDFDLALTRYSGTLQPVIDTLQQDDRFVVLISTDNMESWTILRQWDNAGSEYVYNNITCSATGEHVSFDLSAYVGQNVRIAFYGESTVAGGDNNLHIDNVVVGIPIPAGEWMTATTDAATCILTGLIPETDYEVYIESVCEGETSHVTDHITITTDVACPAPTGLSVANITPTSADLSWTTSADAWEIEVADDQTPPVVTTRIADTNPFTVPDLNPETEYTVRVRANCDGEGYSEWSASATFTTLIACPVPFDVEVDTVTYNSATVAWTGFSDSYILNWAYGEIHPLINVNFEDQTIPANWTNTATADTLVWTVVTDTIHNSYCMISGNAGVASSTSEVSCVMTYPNDGTIEFDAQCMGEGTSWDVCRFLIDDDIKLAKGANGIQWDHYSFAVTAGEHTFTWIYSKDSSVNGKGDHFAVDNIKMYYENLIRQDPITAENTPYTFTGLTPETNYYVTVQGVCGDEQAEPSGLISFKTADYDWTGCGLENDPYIITTTEELGMLALCVNSGNGFSGKFFKQVADIDMSGIAFTSIGNSDNPFSGTFDGQGYTVSGISIDKSDGSCLGLFGHINNGAVKNVTLANSSISGSDYVGGIVGCIDGGTVMNSLVIGAAVSGENNTGAVVGSNSGNLSYNYYSGCTVTVNGTVNDAGVGCGNPSGDITDDDGALAATVLSESSAVPSDLSGKVVFRRMFTGSSASTVCLPFEYTPADGVGGFYTFAGIEKDHDTWVATMMETGAGNNMVNGALMANIPYLFMPAGTDSIVPVLFHGPAASEISAGTATDGDWKFTGTYTRLTYGTEPMVGYIYGFASKSRTYDGQNVEAGEFVQAMDGASVPPMRCYLIYKEGEEMPYNVFIRDEAGRDWELPARITVRLVSAEGNVTAVGSIDTSTGDVTIDTWYDMSGRPINGIPTSPGLYINNGEKIRLNGRIYD